MTSASKITPIGAILVLATLIAALTVPAASASPLLSGYGGPGQGNQVILGSALLNGRSGGGGPGGSSGGGTSGGEDLAVPTSQSSAAEPSRRKPASGASGEARAKRPHAPATRATQDASRSAAAAYVALERERGSRPVLGFSGSDLLYVVLGLGVLILTGVLTRRLGGRRPASKGGGSRGAAHVPTRE
jgi:hypothetical protein